MDLFGILVDFLAAVRVGKNPETQINLIENERDEHS